MDRFQILKGIEPPPLTAKEKLDAEALRIFQDTVDKSWHPDFFPAEALTIVNGQKGWLNKNGTFYPEDEVKKELARREFIFSNINIIPCT